MQFEETAVAGCFVVRPEPRADHRGHFARIWCSEELGRKGLVNRVVQINTGFSPKAGTMRGMHWQQPPHAEVKIARCTRGAVFDVAVDLRRNSPTYRRWTGHVLTQADSAMLYVPEGCAHGYLTLEPDSELMYLTSHAYAPDCARGLRHDDPAFGIAWPAPVAVISSADAGWPSFRDDMAVVLE